MMNGIEPTSRQDVESAADVRGSTPKMGINDYKNKPRLPLKRPRTDSGNVTPNRPTNKVFYGISNLSSYTILAKLGEGTFGEVSKARQLSSGKLVALKKLIIHNKREGFPITALREINILKQLKHENVLTLLDMVYSEAHKNQKSEPKPGDFYMVSPYMAYDLTGLLENPRVNLEIPHIKCFMQQLLRGIQYIHEQHFFHRDIKAANILIDYNGILKIADFGLARKYHGRVPTVNSGPGGGEREYTGLVVTRWYRPPELLLNERKYTTSVDMWGIGCVFAEMFTHKPILRGESDAHQAEIVFQLMGSPNSNDWPEYRDLKYQHVTIGPFKATVDERFEKLMGKDAVDLLKRLLAINPLKRWNALKALDHQYFLNSPLPVLPHELPKFEESHEIDSKRYKEERMQKEKGLEREKEVPNHHQQQLEPPHQSQQSHQESRQGYRQNFRGRGRDESGYYSDSKRYEGMGSRRRDRPDSSYDENYTPNDEAHNGKFSPNKEVEQGQDRYGEHKDYNRFRSYGQGYGQGHNDRYGNYRNSSRGQSFETQFRRDDDHGSRYPRRPRAFMKDDTPPPSKSSGEKNGVAENVARPTGNVYKDLRNREDTRGQRASASSRFAESKQSRLNPPRTVFDMPELYMTSPKSAKSHQNDTEPPNLAYSATPTAYNNDSPVQKTGFSKPAKPPPDIKYEGNPSGGESIDIERQQQIKRQRVSPDRSGPPGLAARASPLPPKPKTP